MLHNLTGWHALVILAIMLLVFGASKLPALAKSVGQSMRILKDEVREGTDADTAPTASTVAPAVAGATDHQAAPVTGRPELNPVSRAS
ncbi:twin-arginine translocase TatA/TatE family subunit [Dietzia maris]